MFIYDRELIHCWNLSVHTILVFPTKTNRLYLIQWNIFSQWIYLSKWKSVFCSIVLGSNKIWGGVACSRSIHISFIFHRIFFNQSVIIYWWISEITGKHIVFWCSFSEHSIKLIHFTKDSSLLCWKFEWGYRIWDNFIFETNENSFVPKSFLACR